MNGQSLTLRLALRYQTFVVASPIFSLNVPLERFPCHFFSNPNECRNFSSITTNKGCGQGLNLLAQPPDLGVSTMREYSVKIRLNGSLSYVTVRASSSGKAKEFVQAQYAGSSVTVLEVKPV